MTLYRSPEYEKSDPWAGAPFYPRAVILTSQLDVFNEVSGQLAFRFRRTGMGPWRPSWISNRNDFIYFFVVFVVFVVVLFWYFYKSPRYLIRCFESIGPEV